MYIYVRPNPINIPSIQSSSKNRVQSAQALSISSPKLEKSNAPYRYRGMLVCDHEQRKQGYDEKRVGAVKVEVDRNRGMVKSRYQMQIQMQIR